MRLVEWSSGGLLPDLVIFLKVPVETADSRLGDHRDRMEREDVDFANRVIEGFNALAHADPGRWRVIDGSGSVDEVAERVAGVHGRGHRLGAVPHVQLGRMFGWDGSPHGQAHN